MNKKQFNCAIYIGKVAVFYIPVCKLTDEVREKLHVFFVQNYKAYTHETSKIQGFWMNHDILVKDDHERYEISFEGKDKVKIFVDFLSEICTLIQEDSIYLTMGNHSWLVKGKI